MSTLAVGRVRAAARTRSFAMSADGIALAGLAFLGLALLVALARMPVSPPLARLAVAGAAAGVVALSKPELEVAALAAAAAWCVSRRLSLRQVCALAAPALAIPAFVYGAFLTQVSLHALLFDNLYPTRVLQAGGDKLLRLHAPLTASSIVHHGEHVVLYAAGIGTMFSAAWLIDRSPSALS